jgi:hypothetical protein
MPWTTPGRNAQRGFTLVELVILRRAAGLSGGDGHLLLGERLRPSCGGVNNDSMAIADGRAAL